jgi:hypothetical protein
MRRCRLKAGEVVQVKPGSKVAPRCFLVVTVTAAWGVLGYVQNSDEEDPQYFRVPWSDIEPTGGCAVWAEGDAPMPEPAGQGA